MPNTDQQVAIAMLSQSSKPKLTTSDTMMNISCHFLLGRKPRASLKRRDQSRHLIGRLAPTSWRPSMKIGCPSMVLSCLVLALSSQVIHLQSRALAATTTSAEQQSGAPNAAANHTQQLATGASAHNKTSSSGLDSQPTDLSSMYVQIPIAEPVESTSSSGNGADGSQAQNRNQIQADGAADESQSSQEKAGGTDKASTWTGPWPKKFQIGYIKQSDLHQVLIESLLEHSGSSTSKPQEAAAGKTGPPGAKSSAAPSTKTKLVAPPSDAASLMAYPQIPRAAASVFARPPTSGAALSRGLHVPMRNLYGLGDGAPMVNQQQAVFNSVPPRAHQHRPQQLQAYRLQMGAHNFHQQQFQTPAGFPHQQRAQMFQPQQQLNHAAPLQAANFQQQQSAKVLPMAPNYLQPQQFQFANAHFASFKNQPIYTMNNNFQQPQQHQQPIEEQVQVIQLGQQRPAFSGAGQRGQKSDYYSSSWRPVSSDGDQDKGALQQQLQQQVHTPSDSAALGSPSLNDGFDDEFGVPAPASPASSKGAQSTNRLPASESFAGDERASKTRPSKTSGGTKSTATKSAQPGQQATKGEAMERRAVPAANGTTPAPTEPSEQAATTASSLGEQTTLASTDPTAPTTQAAEATTEPDSEVLDATTPSPASSTESSAVDQDSAVAATTASSTDSSTSTTASSSSSSSTDGAEQQQKQAASSSAPANREATTAATGSSTSSTTPSSREETTPKGFLPGAEVEEATGASNATSSANAESSGKLLAGTDTSATDEQLQAAAMRASSELNKANGRGSKAKSSRQLQRSASPASGSTKRTRSSERSQRQQEAASSRSSGASKSSNQSNRLITKRPQSPGAAARAVKQTQGGGATKQQQKSSTSAGSKSSAAQKSAAKKRVSNQQVKKSDSKATSGSQKITRMASGGPSTGDRLQAAPAPQFVSMSAAQAQSTAQTLATLLLSRCLTSNNCAHLLDVCTTKQAAVPLSSDGGATAIDQFGSASAANWSVPVGLMSSNLMSLMTALQADKVLRLFPQWRDAIENVVDQDASTGYTLLMPSNEAVDRMPMAQIEALLVQPSEQMSQLIESHILDSAETLELANGNSLQQASPSATNSSNLVERQRSARLVLQQPQLSRYLKSGRGQLQVNQHRDRMLTINGKRVVYANQPAPANGRIHVIEGILHDWPPQAGQQQRQASRSLDIMETLKQCDKFDGFVTLAEGTGLTSILKQEGPLTVFVPSNEALRKIPDEELEVIKNNSTALREFLMYHIVNGSYFSQDLRDGQQLASVLEMRPIQVGVRVDGCSRRLVEANTSPMRRADVVAKNGVIHILDWYLTVRDNDWCDPIGSSRAPTEATGSRPPNTQSSTAPTLASERLQELASDQVLEVPEPSVYTASRISTPGNNLPPNHKPTPVSSISQHTGGNGAGQSEVAAASSSSVVAEVPQTNANTNTPAKA